MGFWDAWENSCAEIVHKRESSLVKSIVEEHAAQKTLQDATRTLENALQQVLEKMYAVKEKATQDERMMYEMARLRREHEVAEMEHKQRMRALELAADPYTP